MSRLPAVVRIIVVFSPVFALVALTGAYSWGVNLLVATGSLAATCLLWALFFGDKKEEEEAGLDAGWLNDEFKALLAETSGRGNSMLYTARKLKNTAEEAEQALKENAPLLREMAGAGREVHGALERIGDLLAAAGQTSTELFSGAQRLRKQAVDTCRAVRRGRRLVREGKESMAAANEAALSADESARELQEYTSAIRGIVDTVNTIARRSDLVAMNAGIEATRAGGAAGRGFRVVADEMVKVSKKAARSAEQIEALVEEIEARITAGRERSRDCLDRVEKHGRKVNLLAERMEKIDGSSKDSALRAGKEARGSRKLNETVARAGEESLGIAATGSRQAELSAPVLTFLRGQEERAPVCSRSSVRLVELVSEFKEGADRYKIPRIGYAAGKSEKAAAYLFKHWFKRDGDREVILVEVEADAASEIYTALAAGDLDGTLSCWLPGLHEGYLQEHEERLEVLATNLAGAGAGLVISAGAGILSTGDLAGQEEKTGGVIYLPEQDSSLAARVLQAVEAYNLDYTLEEIKEEDLGALLEGEAERDRWAVAAVKRPGSFPEQLKPVFLEDPLCAFGGEKTIKTVVRPGLKKEYPRLLRALKNFRWSLEDCTEMIELMAACPGADEAAQRKLEKIEVSLL